MYSIVTNQVSTSNTEMSRCNSYSEKSHISKQSQSVLFQTFFLFNIQYFTKKNKRKTAMLSEVSQYKLYLGKCSCDETIASIKKTF